MILIATELVTDAVSTSRCTDSSRTAPQEASLADRTVTRAAGRTAALS
jgi:hypothetical protein